MPPNARAAAYAPASMGNVGVGFDILGLAFCEPGDTVIAERRKKPGVVIKDITGDGGLLPRNPAKNTASVAVGAFLQGIESKTGISLTIQKGLPLSSGLGSSAASAVAAVVAVNALLGEPCTREELLPACLEGEALVSGFHADNAGPSLLGGITLITGTDITAIRHLPIPPNLYLALVTPDVAVPTLEARAVLPDVVSLKTMVNQTASVATLVDALHRGDIGAMGAAMEADYVVEPARAYLMPLMKQVRANAKQHGAHGLVISGAGPSLCAVCDSREAGKAATAAMRAVYQTAGIDCIARCTRVDEHGAKVLNIE